MKKSWVYLIGIFFVLGLAGVFLYQNTEKPKFYVSGLVSASPEAASDLSGHSFIFFTIHDEGSSGGMPLAMTRLPLNHDFLKGPYQFTLTRENLFSPNNEQKLPDKFKLRITLSKSDKVSFSKDSPLLSQEFDHLERGTSGLAVKFQ